VLTVIAPLLTLYRLSSANLFCVAREPLIGAAERRQVRPVVFAVQEGADAAAGAELRLTAIPGEMLRG